MDDKLLPISTLLTDGVKALEHANTVLNDAAQQNTESSILLDTAHAELQQYQVTSPQVTRSGGYEVTRSCVSTAENIMRSRKM